MSDCHNTTQATRSFLKCEQCRREHKKCSPQYREWQSQRQRCDRCIRLGHSCGPSVRKSRTTRNDTIGIEVDEDLHDESRTASEGGPPALPFSESVLTISVRNNEVGFHKLATMVALLEIMLLCLLICEQSAQNPTVEPTRVCTIRELLFALGQRVQAAFERVRQTVEEQLMMISPTQRELFGWKLMFLEARHDHLVQTLSLMHNTTEISNRDRHYRGLPYLSAEGQILSCTSKIFTTFQAHVASLPGQTQLKRDDYIAFHDQIEELEAEFSELTEGALPLLIGSGSEILRSFPVSHIAYWNHDREVALELMGGIQGGQSDTDILGRTLLHVAAASCDLYTVQRIEEYYPNAVLAARPDHFGFFPHSLVSGTHSDALVLWFRERLRSTSTNLQSTHTFPSPHHLSQRLQAQGLVHTALAINQDQHKTITSANFLADLDNLDIEQYTLEMFDPTRYFNQEDLYRHENMNAVQVHSANIAHEDFGRDAVAGLSSIQYQFGSHHPYDTSLQFLSTGNVDPFCENFIDWSE